LRRLDEVERSGPERGIGPAVEEEELERRE